MDLKIFRTASDLSTPAGARKKIEFFEKKRAEAR
jgi:hypothetical protein